VSFERQPIEGQRFDYTQQTFADRTIVALAFPRDWSANHFDPWPSDAKRFDDGRLAVKYDLFKTDFVRLTWELQALGHGVDIEAEVQRIKRAETGTDAERTLLLFIHGLGGEARTTWGMFPTLLGDGDRQFARKYEVDFFSYPTMLVRTIFSRKAPSIQELADALRTQINNRFAGFGSVVLVCHSLGGLIARKYLLDEVKAKRTLRVSGILLFVVPNNGANLANVGKIISWRHRQMRQLCRNSDLIELLNEDWFTLRLPEVVRAKFITGTQDRVVDRFSARATWGNPDVETVVGKGHIDIVKPERDDEVVFIVKRFLNEIEAAQHTKARMAKKALDSGAPGTTAAQSPPLDLVGLLDSQNQPVFEAQVESFVNDSSGICDSDRIVVEAIGAPISQVGVTRLSVFNVRYYDLKTAPTCRTILVLGYYNAGSISGKALGEIYRTDVTRHRRRSQLLATLVLETPIDGYKVFVDLCHYLRISYRDRSDRIHNRCLEVDEMGFRGLSEDDWNELRKATQEGPHFDFDAGSDGDFIQLLRRYLPTRQG
jgi:hypothetical protein